MQKSLYSPFKSTINKSNDNNSSETIDLNLPSLSPPNLNQNQILSPEILTQLLNSNILNQLIQNNISQYINDQTSQPTQIPLTSQPTQIPLTSPVPQIPLTSPVPQTLLATEPIQSTQLSQTLLVTEPQYTYEKDTTQHSDYGIDFDQIDDKLIQNMENLVMTRTGIVQSLIKELNELSAKIMELNITKQKLTNEYTQNAPIKQNSIMRQDSYTSRTDNTNTNIIKSNDIVDMTKQVQPTQNNNYIGLRLLASKKRG